MRKARVHTHAGERGARRERDLLCVCRCWMILYRDLSQLLIFLSHRALRFFFSSTRRSLRVRASLSPHTPLSLPSHSLHTPHSHRVLQALLVRLIPLPRTLVVPWSRSSNAAPISPPSCTRAPTDLAHASSHQCRSPRPHAQPHGDSASPRPDAEAPARHPRAASPCPIISARRPSCPPRPPPRARSGRWCGSSAGCRVGRAGRAVPPSCGAACRAARRAPSPPGRSVRRWR